MEKLVTVQVLSGNTIFWKGRNYRAGSKFQMTEHRARGCSGIRIVEEVADTTADPAPVAPPLAARLAELKRRRRSGKELDRMESGGLDRRIG